MNDIGNFVLYTIDKAIRSYRQLAQRQLVEAGSAITVDQWLILNVIQEHPGISQGAIADLVFKDKASIARSMELMVQAGAVKRTIPANDRRSVILHLSAKGKRQLEELAPIVSRYRKQALKGISRQEIDALKGTLNKLIDNCHE